MNNNSKLYELLSKALALTKTPKQLHKTHTLLITTGLIKSLFFTTTLITQYSKFKDPLSSLSVFNTTTTTNKNATFLWNSTIRALTQNGFFSKSLELYSTMREQQLRFDAHTFPSVINACGAVGDVGFGLEVHDHVVRVGFGSDLYICNALIDMYSRFGDLSKSREVFDEMPKRDLVSWNSLISGYSANGYYEKAMKAFKFMRISGFKPDFYTFSGILPVFRELCDFEDSCLIHGLIEKVGYVNYVVISNGLLSIYFKFGGLVKARKVFDFMVVRDDVSWNTLICGYTQLGLFRESIDCFNEMVKSFCPDLLTTTSVIRACGHLRDLQAGKMVHDYMKESGFEWDITACNILIDMYAKCNDLLHSRQVFDSMIFKDHVSWNSMINGYIQSKNFDDAVKLFNMMKIDARPNFVTYITLLSISAQVGHTDLGKTLHCDAVKLGFDSHLVVCNALVSMYAKCSNVDDSLKVFEAIKGRDVVSWNTVIAACGEAEDCSLAFRLIKRMRSEEDVAPDNCTVLAVLPICSTLVAKQQGREIHAIIYRLGFESEVGIGNALIEMYSKCGDLENAVRVFKHMRTRDVITWTTLISAYGIYGEGHEALQTFEEMEASGIVPDHIAFTSILFACSHSGLVDAGLLYFEKMRKEYKIEPKLEHYACIVDLLSRSGQLSKAEAFICSMPFKPDASIWGALLSASRTRGDAEIAESASKHISGSDSIDPGYHVLASNVYASLGKWDRVKAIRKSIRARGLEKVQGASWI